MTFICDNDEIFTYFYLGGFCISFPCELSLMRREEGEKQTRRGGVFASVRF